MEIRIHGRGGQGGVTCAKLLAAIYARLGKSVQAFGDYAGERSGAPVRAYVRVGDEPITNRNKVYRPDHVLVLDRGLLDDQALAGLAPGGLLLVNAPESPAAFAGLAPANRRAAVDATAIARRHGIGSRSVVIVNTTLAGAFARALELPWEALEEAYRQLGLDGDLEAAREAWDAVALDEPAAAGASAARLSPSPAAEPPGPRVPAAVVDLVAHTSGPAPALRTGSWRTQTPRYARHLSPCNAVCPVGNDVVGFVQALARDGEEAAAEVLSRTNPFPGVCGRVCPGFCVRSCNRRSFDGAVQVRDLERWIADRVPVARVPPVLGGGRPSRSRRVAVVGGGPAGLSAAYTLLRHGHRPTVYEAAPALGGLLRNGIPPYRLPWEVVSAELRALLDLGVEERCGRALGPADLEDLAGRYDGLLLATGQQRRQGLDVPGLDLGGIEHGLDFLPRAEGAISEFPLARHVLVLGGGNTAIDCARSAVRRGADRVTLVYRRSRAEMPAIPEEVEEAVDEGVELLFLHAPVAFYPDGSPPGAPLGDPRRWVGGVELGEMRLGPPDASGRRRPVPTGRHTRMDCDLVLLALGQSTDESLLPPGWTFDGDHVVAGGRVLPVAAAGDFATGEGTVAHALGDGRRAALALLAHLGEAVAPWRRPDPAEAVPPERIRMEHFPPAPAARARHRPTEVRRHDWAEVSGGLATAAEAGRCFACGDCTRCDTCLVYCPDGAIARDGDGYVIDYDVCKGCGICVAECPRDGMEMVDLCLAT